MVWTATLNKVLLGWRPTPCRALRLHAPSAALGLGAEGGPFPPPSLAPVVVLLSLSVSAVPSACLPVCRRPFLGGVSVVVCVCLSSSCPFCFCLFVCRRSCVSCVWVSVGRRVLVPSAVVCAVLLSAKVRYQPRCWPLPCACVVPRLGRGFLAGSSVFCFGLGPLLFSGRCAARCSGCLGCSGWGPPCCG